MKHAINFSSMRVSIKNVILTLQKVIYFANFRLQYLSNQNENVRFLPFYYQSYRDLVDTSLLFIF